MKKKLPTVFKNTKAVIDGHNKSIFYSFQEDRNKEEEVVFKEEPKVEDHVLTSDRRMIYLKDILSIHEKNHD